MGWVHKAGHWSEDPDGTPLYDQLKADIMGRHTDEDGNGRADTADAEEPAPERIGLTVGASSTAADILAAHGILRATEVVELAGVAGLDLAAAAAMLTMETGDKKNVQGGGRNVWGGDHVVVAPNTYTKGGVVTAQNYAAYHAAVLGGRAGRQGVGPCQLTYHTLQVAADALGGCWDWRNNAKVGFPHLAGLIKANGLRGGFRAYNGSDVYATDAMNCYNVWCSRLAGAPDAPTGGGAVADRHNAMITALYQQMSGSPNVGEWPGWPSFPEGSGYSLTMVDYLRQSDVQLRTLLTLVAQLQADVAALKAKWAP